MSKLREDYSATLFSKVEDFVNGTEPEVIKDDTDIVYVEDVIDNDEEIITEEMEIKENDTVNKNIRLMEKLYPYIAVIVGFTIIAMLVMTVSYMPLFGQAVNPANNEVPARYIEHGMQETGTVNVVTGLILNYRGFDTMGETHVLFIAASTVMILLLCTKSAMSKAAAGETLSKGTIGPDYKEDRELEPKNDVILKMVATFLVPVIAVFGIYVVLNGHISPGGGFSGGSILGAGLILYVNAFGFKKTEKLFNEEIYKVAKVSALCCYVCCLSYYFYMGANGFDNHIPLGTPGMILSSGLILFIDIFVGTEVACTMYAFYALFRRGEI